VIDAILIVYGAIMIRVSQSFKPSCLHGPSVLGENLPLQMQPGNVGVWPIADFEAK
jgi:hypothetical protein